MEGDWRRLEAKMKVFGGIEVFLDGNRANRLRECMKNPRQIRRG